MRLYVQYIFFVRKEFKRLTLFYFLQLKGVDVFRPDKLFDAAKLYYGMSRLATLLVDQVMVFPGSLLILVLFVFKSFVRYGSPLEIPFLQKFGSPPGIGAGSLLISSENRVNLRCLLFQT